MSKVEPAAIWSCRLISASVTMLDVGSHSRSAACGFGSAPGAMIEMTMMAATATLCAAIETTTMDE